MFDKVRVCQDCAGLRSGDAFGDLHAYRLASHAWTGDVIVDHIAAQRGARGQYEE
jgi:hypothetical protein